MRIFPILPSLLAILTLLSSEAKAQPPASAAPLPSGFDATAKAPPNLPTDLDMPINTRMEVKAWRKTPLPPTPPRPNDPRLLWDPDLEGAVVERAQKDIHAVFHWEGGRTSDGYVIRGVTFHLNTFEYPDSIMASGFPLNFYLNLGVGSASGGAGGNFPGITWYSPSQYSGTAMVDGNPVLVFAINGAKAGGAFPEGHCVCLDAKTHLPVWVNDGTFILTFSYTPAANVQIDPQGPYLKAVQKKFGHYP